MSQSREEWLKSLKVGDDVAVVFGQINQVTKKAKITRIGAATFYVGEIPFTRRGGSNQSGRGAVIHPTDTEP